ncbi:MAG: Ribosomal large subunit pseudouridine synthase B [Candidatus Dichloromethanomonas elyunquensis]|nr:MAG: Ribosomal large subunit pseudouridine synthase B [Candidatus Dichloromethanomonas elyunquensis]
MNETGNQPERLQKAMARMGIASRRHAENLILQGLVKVNGTVVTQPGVKVTSGDKIEVQGQKKIPSDKEESVYILLNKPAGVICSVTDPQKRKTVTDLIRNEIQERLYPVGRLDYDTSGILLLTNDGDLTYRLTHPRYGVEKTYQAWITGDISPQALKLLREGVPLEDGLTSPAKILSVWKHNKGNNLSVVEISIHEGRNRQVRRMFDKTGYPVCYLKRIAFGPIKLEGEMKPGEFRRLTKSEIASLKKAVGLKPKEWGEES